MPAWTQKSKRVSKAHSTLVVKFYGGKKPGRGSAGEMVRALEVKIERSGKVAEKQTSGQKS